MPYTALDAMNEAAQYGTRPTCKQCHQTTTPAECVISEMVDEVFCSEGCRDAYETAFTDYMNAEQARAARTFRNRTPEAARRVSEWNVWADGINTAQTRFDAGTSKPLTAERVRQMSRDELETFRQARNA